MSVTARTRSELQGICGGVYVLMGSWHVYRDNSEWPSPVVKEWHGLSLILRGYVRWAMHCVAKGDAPPPDECPTVRAIRCFTVPSGNTNIHVLWALLEDQRHLLLHVNVGDTACPGAYPYEVARARLNDAAT